ncbi:hypothetical protein PWT90_07528 [Aphanocladium album]|nr:hypothetical protein PWT90_07528 [Aphanocladium album]
MSQEHEKKKPATALNYRVATADDAVFLQRMVQDSFRRPDTWEGDMLNLMSQYSITLERMREKLNRPGSIFIIASESRPEQQQQQQPAEPVACFQVVQKSPTLARFATFAVATKHQGRGLARPIVEHAEDYCRRTWGTTTMQLNTLSSRTGLLAWYRRCGYRETGVKEPFPSGDVEETPEDLCFVVMEKELEAATTSETA